MVFENGVKNIQAAAYNGASTVSHDNVLKFLVEFSEVVEVGGDWRLRV
jgi:hypothetical protein